MNEQIIRSLYKQINKPDQDILKKSREHWDNVAKPLDGLGDLEKMISKIAAIKGTADISLGRKKVLVLCADNGIVEEGISQSGSEVTAIVAESITRSGSSVCRMAAVGGAIVEAADMGISEDLELPGLLRYARDISGEDYLLKPSRGTENFLKKPSMTSAQALHAIYAGVLLAKREYELGTDIIASGEMGIGNTTTSAAMACLLLDLPVSKTVGRGAGLTDDKLLRKRAVVEEAVTKYSGHINEGEEVTDKERPAITDNKAFRILTDLGGYDIAGMVGLFLGGAIYRIPVIIDGVISAVAAVTAERLFPGVKDYMLASHGGREPAHRLLLGELGLKPVIDADLALGEGSGAVMLFPLLDMALSVYKSAADFGDIGVENYKRS